MLSLTMRQAMTELTDELMTEGKCAAFISTNGQPVSNQVKYSTRVVNAYLLHPVSDSSICAPAQMLTRDEFIIQPAYAFAMMCPTAVAIATQILANAGFEPAQAANMAIIHDPLPSHGGFEHQAAWHRPTYFHSSHQTRGRCSQANALCGVWYPRAVLSLAVP